MLDGHPPPSQTQPHIEITQIFLKISNGKDLKLDNFLKISKRKDPKLESQQQFSLLRSC